MKDKGLLITSISKKFPLIKAVREAVLNTLLFNRIHGCDADFNCIGQYGVDVFWHTPPLKEMNKEMFLAYCLENRIGLIIPTREEDILFFAAHLEFFERKGIEVMVGSYESVSLCLDKLQWSQTLIKKGFPVIASYVTVEECVADRLVVKERSSYFGKEVVIDLNKEEAKFMGLRMDSPIFQPYIEGKEWSVDVYSTKETKALGAVARLRLKVVGGESQITETKRNPDLEELCCRMAECVSLSGPSVFQVIEDKRGKFHVIECNPRFGGASTASIAVGLDTFVWFFTEMTKGGKTPYFTRSEQEVKQVRVPMDLHFWIDV